MADAIPDVSGLLNQVGGVGNILGMLGGNQSGTGGLPGIGGFDISGILNTVQGIGAIVGKIFVFLFALWIGRKAFSGYKGPRNIIVSILGSLGIALLCFVIGLILGYGLFEGLGIKVGTLLAPIVEFIGIGIAAAFFYVFFSVITVTAKLEVVSRKEFEELKKQVSSLADEVHQITKKLMDKKMFPKIVLLEDAIEALKKGIQDKGIKYYRILKSEREGDNWVFNVLVRFSKYRAVVSPAGTLKEFEKEKIKLVSFLLGIVKNKRLIVGIILIIVFALIVNNSWTVKAGLKLNEYLGIGLKCYTIDELKAETGIKSNNTDVLNSVITEQPDFNRTKYTLKEYNVKGEIYYLISGYVKSEEFSCSLLRTEICECTKLSNSTSGGLTSLLGGLI